MTSLVRALYITAGVLGATAAYLRFGPLPAESAAARARMTATAPSPTRAESTAAGATAPLGSYATLVDSNMFSPARTAPRTRFSLHPVEPPPKPVRVAPRAPEGPRLYGVTVRQTDPTALIDADPAVPGAEIYHLGDIIPGGRIVAISEEGVVLEGQNGRRLLRLETRPKPR